MSHLRCRTMCAAICSMLAPAMFVGCQASPHAGRVLLDHCRRIPVDSARVDAENSVNWYDAKVLTVEGKGWADTEKFYDRLPAKAQQTVPEPVWTRSRHSSGMCVRFVTDSATIRVRWTVTSPMLAMNHMPATGVSGVDLYVRSEGRWRWLATGVPNGQSSEVELATDIPAGGHEYRLYLPLYNGTESLEVGVDRIATLAHPQSSSDSRPVVFYGTSITHGGCASRPGMAYPAILGRWLDVPTINLGFSGSGKMEPAMADLLAELDAAVYVLDCLPNMTPELVTERVEPFVRRLRAARPHTPIVLVESITYQNGYFNQARHSRTTDSNNALSAAYQALKRENPSGLFYLTGERLLGDDDEATVDGVHPTDLGFLRIAQAMWPVLRSTVGTRYIADALVRSVRDAGDQRFG